MQTKKCIQCGIIFDKPLSCSKKEWIEQRKFCSTKCHNDFRRGKTFYNSGQFKNGDKATHPFEKGNIPWNKDLKGIHLSPDTEWKEGQYAGENHYNWKGGISPPKQKTHIWVIRHKGKASNYKCKCGKQALDWSNKKHDYKKNLDDYVARCRKCHIAYDVKYNGYKQ